MNSKCLLCLGIIFRPATDELVQMMWTQDRPIASEIIKVVHDDGHEQIDDLKHQYETVMHMHTLVSINNYQAFSQTSKMLRLGEVRIQSKIFFLNFDSNK